MNKVMGVGIVMFIWAVMTHPAHAVATTLTLSMSGGKLTEHQFLAEVMGRLDKVTSAPLVGTDRERAEAAAKNAARKLVLEGRLIGSGLSGVPGGTDIDCTP